MPEILHVLFHALTHTLTDTLSLVPFLFITYLVMETLEHKAGGKAKRFIAKSGAFGPVAGAILGILPQCGFSAATASLFSSGVIGGGTLIAVFLSTSDEMLPVMLSKGLEFSEIARILTVKVIIAVASGFLFSVLCPKKEDKKISHHCHEEGCHCERGILPSALFHTLGVSLFIFISVFIFECIMSFVGEDTLATLMTGVPVLSNIVSAAVGLIPSCASSVIITELYVEGLLSWGAMLSGLLVSSGVGILVLFRTNKNMKENLKTVLFLFAVGALSGIFFDLTSF